MFVAPVQFTGTKNGEFYVGAYVIKDVNTTRYKIHEVLTINKEGNRPFQPEADQSGEHLRDDFLLNTKVTQSKPEVNQNDSADKSLAATVKKFFRDIAKLVKKTIDAYKGHKPDSVEGKLVASMEDIYRQLQEVFAEGVYQGSENTEFLENSVAPTEGLYYSKRKGYQIIKKLTAKEYRLEAKDYGEITDYESLQSTSDKNAALLRGIRESGGRGYRVDPSLPEYRGKDNPIHGVGSTQNRGRSNEHNSARDHAGSGLDRQGQNRSSLKSNGFRLLKRGDKKGAWH